MMRVRVVHNLREVGATPEAIPEHELPVVRIENRTSFYPGVDRVEEGWREDDIDSVVSACFLDDTIVEGLVRYRDSFTEPFPPRSVATSSKERQPKILPDGATADSCPGLPDSAQIGFQDGMAARRSSQRAAAAATPRTRRTTSRRRT